MTEIRAFISIDLSHLATEALETALMPWKNTANSHRVEWILPFNYHMTLVFLGNIKTNRVPEIISCLTQVASDFSTIPLFLKSLDYFPDPKHPKVLAAHIEPIPELLRLQAQIAQAVNMPREAQAFLPHITVGRFRERSQPRPEFVPLALSITSMSSELCLYQSRLGEAGVRYEKLAEIPFAKS